MQYLCKYAQEKDFASYTDWLDAIPFSYHLIIQFQDPPPHSLVDRQIYTCINNVILTPLSIYVGLQM